MFFMHFLKVFIKNSYFPAYAFFTKRLLRLYCSFPTRQENINFLIRCRSLPAGLRPP